MDIGSKRSAHNKYELNHYKPNLRFGLIFFVLFFLSYDLDPPRPPPRVGEGVGLILNFFFNKICKYF